MYDTFTNETTRLNDFGDLEESCGAPMAAFHRGDLHAELLNTARDTLPWETPVELFKGVKIVRIDSENAEIELADGTVHRGDLLIAADGLHSAVREVAIKDDKPAIDSCWQIYRFLLTKEEVLNDEALQEFKFDNTRMLWFHDEPNGESIRYVWYSCRK
jgi:salicylate hydroxylase